jgi:DNA-binding transcriptional ArsR family regulator
MRPLQHPLVESLTVEGIFHALSDPVRANIFAQIVGSECTQSCSDFLCTCEKDIPKSTLSQHFKVLREAGLIRSERRGVEMLSCSRQDEIDKRFPGLITAFAKAHRVQSGGKRVRTARSA